MCASHIYRDLQRICLALSWSDTSCPKPYHGTFDEMVLNVQKSQESDGICFEVYQLRKNKSKKLRRNITERVITSRTLAIEIEPTNPGQR